MPLRSVSLRSVAWLFCLLPAAVFAAERPNVVLIVTDDQGYGDFGATGNDLIETPRIDALASRSVLFDTFYVSPVCSPTRASLMTGRYNYRTRVVDTWLARSMMEPDEATIAEALREGGYATGLFGKWHLGDCCPMRPQEQGFDEVLMHRGGGLAQPSEPRENDNRYTDPVLFHNGEKVHAKGYCTDVYFDAALEFVDRSLSDDEPFFAYIATNAPHGPYHDVPEELLRHYKAKDLTPLMIGDSGAKAEDQLARIAAMITNIDENVGRLVDRLEATGALENTLILVMVDNGPNTRRYVGPFRGKKTEIYEGGVRSPLWLHWPRGIGTPRTIDKPVAHIDVMPTVLDLCGVEPPAAALDGRSLAPLIRDPEAEWQPRVIAIQTHRGERPLRYHHFMIRDERWKLLHASGFRRESFDGPPRLELYDLLEDPGETSDRSGERPEVVERLRAAYDAWFDDVTSTRVDNFTPPRIHIGDPREEAVALTRQDWRGGWRFKQMGYWSLRVVEADRYDLRVLFEAAPSDRTLVVTIGDERVEHAVAAGLDETVVKGVPFSDGDLRFEMELHGPNGARGVHQVIVRRMAGG